MSAITDQSHQDTAMLNQVFDECDKIISGQVKTNDLIARVMDVWPQTVNERESKVYINDLTRRLDSRKDNCYVEREIFVKCGLDWIEFIRTKSNNNASLSTSSLASSDSHIEHLLEESVEKKQSLYFDPNATFGSLEGINGASFSAKKASIVELQEEIEELKKQTKSMFEDKTKIANQLNLSEDSNVLLNSQNQDSQNRLKSLKTSLDNALKYQQDMDELKTIAKNKEEELNLVEQNHLKNNSRIVELTNENMELQSKLDETVEQLNGALGEIQSAKKSHCIAIDLLRKKDQEIMMKNQALMEKNQEIMQTLISSICQTNEYFRKAA